MDSKKRDTYFIGFYYVLLYNIRKLVVIMSKILFTDAQVKKLSKNKWIKNITNKVIKAARISILSFDTVGNLIDGETNHEYLDLSAVRYDEFGQKTPIILPNNSTRSFSVIQQFSQGFPSFRHGS